MPSTTPKDYVTLSARVPRTLVDAVTRYASQHRFPVSELIRDGLEWRIEQETPGRAQTSRSADSNGQTVPESHDVLHVLQGWLPVLQDTIRQTMQDVRHDVVHAQSPDTVPGEPLTANQGADHQDVRQDVVHDTSQAVPVPDFDPDKFVLGKLCPQGHEWGHTGQSLLRKHSQGCRECDNTAKRAKRAHQKAAHP